MKNILLYIILAATLLISCEENPKEGTKSKAVTKLENFGNELLFISNSWMRPGATNRNTAAFLNITNNTDVDDTLFSVQSNLAKVVQLHETYDKGNDMMGMRHVDCIIIPSESKVELKPGSFHIMLIGLKKDLKKGDVGIITLNFSKNRIIKLKAEVK